MRISPSVLAVALCVVVAGCTRPTPYAPAVDGLGYDQREIETNRYRVSFSANSLTTRETVENYLLYRAAEITLQSGNDWFSVGDKDIVPHTVYQSYGDGFPGYWGPYGYRGAFYNPGPRVVTSAPMTSYDAFATILVHKGAKPADDMNAYDARDVQRRLAGLIQRPAEATHGDRAS